MSASASRLQSAALTPNLQCDGQMPCKRCRTRGEECAYEDKKWRTKDHLRSEIERLRTEQQQGRALIRALTDHDPRQLEAIIDRMRNDEPPDTIAKWIQSTRGLPSASNQQPQVGIPDNLGLSDTASPLLSPFRQTATLPSSATPGDRIRAASFSTPDSHPYSIRSGTSGGSGLSQAYDGLSRRSYSADLSSVGPPSSIQGDVTFPTSRMPGSGSQLLGAEVSPHSSQMPPQFLTSGTPGTPDPNSRTWTAVTKDTHLVQRLMNRFFAGSFSSLTLIPKTQFTRDFVQGGNQYCSEALVNAILGKTCKLLGTTEALISRVSYGGAFLGEARRLLDIEPTHVSFPSIQALGVLALAEIIQGSDEEAWHLAQEAVRSSIHLMLQTRDQDCQVDPDFRAVRALTFCGVFTLVR